MDVLFLLIPIALGFLVLALAIFFWAIRNGQYDDMQSHGLKIVIDDKQEQRRVNQQTTSADTSKIDEH